MNILKVTSSTFYGTPKRVSCSSWALHPLLNRTYPGLPGDPSGYFIKASGESKLSLLEVPAKLAEHGIHTMELCHFHVPSRDATYLNELKVAIAEAGVELWSLLVDVGDIAHPEHSARNTAWVRDWLDVAVVLGAKRSRVIAGDQPPTEANFERGIQAMSSLVKHVDGTGLRVMTENWFELLPDAVTLNRYFERMNSQIGLCFDFGNWHHADKYDQLEQIVHLTESCHAKCVFNEQGEPDLQDFQ